MKRPMPMPLAMANRPPNAVARAEVMERRAVMGGRSGLVRRNSYALHTFGKSDLL